MIRHGAAAMGLAALLAAGCNIEAQTSAVEGSFERTLQVGNGVDVSITSRSGEIRVQTGAPGAVHVRARIRAYGMTNLFQTYSPSEQVKRLEANPPVEQRGQTVVIGDPEEHELVQNVTISYDVTVPPDVRLTTTSRSGSQTIAAVRGTIDASARSGDIVINGAPAARWTVETRSGDVELRVPNDAAFDVNVQTRSGSIRTGKDIESAGQFSRRGFDGRVRGGGARVAVQTRSGSVSID